jgi:hypothetical protein
MRIAGRYGWSGACGWMRSPSRLVEVQPRIGKCALVARRLGKWPVHSGDLRCRPGHPDIMPGMGGRASAGMEPWPSAGRACGAAAVRRGRLSTGTLLRRPLCRTCFLPRIVSKLRTHHQMASTTPRLSVIRPCTSVIQATRHGTGPTRRGQAILSGTFLPARTRFHG